MRPNLCSRWDYKRVAAVAIGGVAGAGLRWAVLTSIEPGTFPWPVFVINVVGSVLLGVLLAEEWTHPSFRVLLHDAGGIGFCGGLTTFSTFSVEVVNLIRAGETAIAITYTTLSIFAAIVGVIAGAAALRRLRTLSLALEEKP